MAKKQGVCDTQHKITVLPATSHDFSEHTCSLRAPHNAFRLITTRTIDEGQRVGRPQPPLRGSRPLLGPRSSPEALERCRVNLSIHKDGKVDRMTAGRAEEAQGAALKCSRTLVSTHSHM